MTYFGIFKYLTSGPFGRLLTANFSKTKRFRQPSHIGYEEFWPIIRHKGVKNIPQVLFMFLKILSTV